MFTMDLTFQNLHVLNGLKEENLFCNHFQAQGDASPKFILTMVIGRIGSVPMSRTEIPSFGSSS